MAKWYESKIIRIEDQAPMVKRFWFEIQGEECIDFKAGQFVVMDLPIHERRLKRWRSYSIANAPNETNVLEFCIVKTEKGWGTGYLFDEAKVGTSIKLKEPYGMFVLPDKIEKKLILLCTGTGVAPFRSMLWDIYNNKKPHKGIHLIFGTRFKEGILYRHEFESLVERMPGFEYTVALSREEQLYPSDYAFEINKGYIHPIYEERYRKGEEGLEFYICGWQVMIDDAVAKLKKMGYDPRQIHYESYG